MSKFVNLKNTAHRTDGKYEKVIEQIREDGVCPFCPEHLLKYHKNPILKEGAYWLLTKNMYPYEGAKHHALVIHKKHIELLDQITPEAWAELQSIIQSFAKENNILGGTLLMRFGHTSHTGATVSHLHANFVSPDGEDKDRKPIMVRIG